MSEPKTKTPSKKKAPAKKAERLFYSCHVFCCVNERDEDHPRGSCSRRGGVELRDHMKAKAKEILEV